MCNRIKLYAYIAGETAPNNAAVVSDRHISEYYNNNNMLYYASFNT